MFSFSESKLIGFAVLQLSVFILSMGGIAAKSASFYPIGSFKFIGLYAIIIMILAVYAILWQQLLKRFDLMTAYLNKGTLIIWTFIWATLFFNETITFNNIAGSLLIILGITLVAKDA